jgi:hypothetical protein
MARDMTEKQFKAALTRRGWRKVLMWIDLGRGHSVGLIMIKGPRGYKVNRRASLAHAIRTAEADALRAALAYQ